MYIPVSWSVEAGGGEGLAGHKARDGHLQTQISELPQQRLLSLTPQVRTRVGEGVKLLSFQQHNYV